MREKLKIGIPIIVEGKYDKIKLSSIVDGNIITTGGFSVFRSEELLSLIRRIADKHGIIVLTDSDGAGKVIRRHIASAVPKDKIYNLYIPQIEGKEKRKKAPSAEGYLGVEGVEIERLYSLLAPFASKGGENIKTGGITKGDLYLLGMSGGEDAVKRRDIIASHFGLPKNMSANALLAALDLITSKEELVRLSESLF